MASEKPTPSVHPEVIDSDLDVRPNASAAGGDLYPSIDKGDLEDDLIHDDHPSPSAPPLSMEEILIRVSGVILHLIDKEYSVELACGDLTITALHQGENIVAVLAQVEDEIQWPLTKDEAGVKVDQSHYFFSFRESGKADEGSDSSDDEENGGAKKNRESDSSALLSYGLTIASKGQDDLLNKIDAILEKYCSFSVQKVSEKAKKAKGGEVFDSSVVRDTAPAEMKSRKKKKMIEEQSAAFWTTLAPNVEDYGGVAAKLIAAGSGQLIRGILWCGDVAVERLNWGDEVLKKRLGAPEKREISPETLKRIKRAKKLTKMTEKVATGVLSGVVRVSGFFTSKVTNSSAGKVCDAVEVTGKNLMSTSSTVTTGLVSHRYGEEVAQATSEGMDAAGHALGTAWAVFKIRKAFNPKTVIKPSALVKSAAKATAAEAKSKGKKSK